MILVINIKYEKCENKIKCEGKLNFKCGSDYCAQNKGSCNTALNLMFLHITYKRFLMFEEDIKKYSNLLNSINYCAVNEYSLQPDVVCINGDGCFNMNSTCLQ
jgi:hypothetical protein